MVTWVQKEKDVGLARRECGKRESEKVNATCVSELEPARRRADEEGMWGQAGEGRRRPPSFCSAKR